MNTLIQDCINNKFSKTPIWLMRQAGRYLPEFRSIREKNQNFIKLCLNTKLSSEITIQPINRFGFDAAIIFSDILLVPYALGQQVNFKKNFGPDLKKIDLNILNDVKKEDFLKKLNPKGIMLDIGKQFLINKLFSEAETENLNTILGDGSATDIKNTMTTDIKRRMIMDTHMVTMTHIFG